MSVQRNIPVSFVRACLDGPAESESGVYISP